MQHKEFWALNRLPARLKKGMFGFKFLVELNYFCQRCKFDT